MARKGITYTQVQQAADAIKARGLEPTIHAIRTELGNEGSYTTISAHLAKWKDEKAGQRLERELPEEAENAALQAITTVWQIAVNYAWKETQAVQQELDDTKKRMGAELAEQAKEIEQLEAQLETAQLGRSQALHETQEIQKKNAKLEGQLGALQKSYDDLLRQIKQPAGKALKAVDTMPEHPAGKPDAPGKKQA